MAKMPRTEFPPPGFDPTKEAVNVAALRGGPKLSGCMTWLFLIAAVFLVGGKLFFDGVKAEQAAQAEDVTAIPTVFELPTIAPDTATPGPTSTGTITPEPTPTITPTWTPTMLPPGMMATWTPGPWMLTRYAKGMKANATPTLDPTVRGLTPTATRAR